MARVDPELEQQLSSVSAETPLAALFRLSGSERMGREFDLAARTVVKDAENATGLSAERINVLKNIGVLIVLADANLIRAILNDARVESAMANEQSDTALGKTHKLAK